MALYAVSQGGLVNAGDVQQIINLLTGNMSDQPVTIANRVRAASTGAASGTGGYVGQFAGSPSGGPWNAGDFATDPGNNRMWLCTAGGSPGTWKSVTFA